MEATRKLRRVGNSIMLPLPPEALNESGFSEGQEVRIHATFGRIDLQLNDGPDAEVAAFAARFVDQYREALTRLATE